MNCQVIEYLDIDEEYDKIEEEAKQIKNAKGPEVLEQKVFLPKFTKPDQKSFKQMIEERLNLKNIDQILDESDDDFKSEPENMGEPSKNKRQLNQQKVDQKLIINNGQKQVFPESRSQDALCPQQQKNYPQKETQDSLFDCLLPICPEIKPQTIRLDSKYFQLPFQTQLPQLFQNHSEPQKDLFDQLLASSLDFDYLSSQKHIYNNSDPEQPETQSECNDENNFKRLKKVSNIQPKIEPKIDDSPLFQNFGHMIYHKKEWGAHDQPNQTKTSTEILPSKIQNFQKPLLSSKQEDSIQIISSDDEAIDVEKIKKIKSHKQIGFSKKHQLRQLIQQKAGIGTVLKIQKGKRLSGKQFYEEAISKSKQLWEKKLRKQKETIILGPKKFELALIPKANWKEKLNEEEKKQLREKGIKFE